MKLTHHVMIYTKLVTMITGDVTEINGRSVVCEADEPTALFSFDNDGSGEFVIGDAVAILLRSA